MTVLLGNEDGTYTSLTSSNVGSYPQNLVVGDFNGDGIPDLAVSNLGDQNLAILLGNGDGTFTPVSQTIASFVDAAVGDFNGDGIPDLAITNNTSGATNGTVSVLLSNGNGTFTTGSTLTVGNKTGSITAADFYGNGILDLATANSGDNTVTVLVGKGNGTFPTQSSINVGNNPEAIAMGDFNGDGLPDLTTANSGDNTVSVLLSELTETAMATLNNLAVAASGTQAVVASYAGDSHFSASISSAVELTTAQVPVTLQLTSSPNLSIIGSEILLTAVLTPSSSINAKTNGETLTFYNAGVKIGTGTLSSGVATLSFIPQLVGSAAFTATYPGDSSFDSATSTSLSQVVTIATPTTTYVVTTNTDTTSGVAADCTSTGSLNCSLRDALTAAAAKGAANITFNSSIFGTPQTITLGSAGGLTIPSGTTINIIGPTTGSGAARKNLVTVNGGGASTVFSVGSSTNASIAGLTITGGSASSTGGGGIDNQGTLVITNSAIVGNTVFVSLGSNLGITDIIGYGGGISSEGGTLTIANSTITGNDANGVLPAGYSDYTVSFSGGGISINGGVTAQTNDIISGNDTNGSEDDCDGSGCGVNGVNGNIVGSNAQLAPAGNYGAPTQTSLPLPGSPAICAGVVADIPAGITTDQRGFPRTTTYGSNPPCVDSGSVQTNYALIFSTEPPASVAPNTKFAAALQLSESGSPVLVSGVSIPLALGAESTGSLNVSSLSTNSSGIAASSALQVSASGTGDTLVSTLPITTAPPPSSLTSAVIVRAVSTPFDVAATSQTITFPALPSTVTLGVLPITLKAIASSGLAVVYSVTGPASISASTLTITGVGTVIVTASQPGNGIYAAATPVSQTITVTQASHHHHRDRGCFFRRERQSGRFDQLHCHPSHPQRHRPGPPRGDDVRQ